MSPPSEPNGDEDGAFESAARAGWGSERRQRSRIRGPGSGVDVRRRGDGFTAIDFETTGFRARKTDRSAEIGVVCMDDSGEMVEAWSTLVNPQRDVSARRLDIRRAIVFSDH